MDFEKKLEQCKVVKGDMEKNECMFKLLHDITVLQDKIQLAIPAPNESIAGSTFMTNSANGILLGISTGKGDIRRIVEGGGYVEEKVRAVVDAWNGIVNNYNLVQRENRKDKIKMESIPGPEPPNEKEIEYFKATILRGFPEDYREPESKRI